MDAMNNKFGDWVHAALSGFTYATDSNRHWIRLYIVIAFIEQLISFWIQHASFALNLSNPSAIEARAIEQLAYSFFSLVFVTIVMEEGLALHAINPQRWFPRFIVLISLTVALLLATIAIINDPQILGALSAGLIALILSTSIILLLLVTSSATFQRDFVGLWMFRAEYRTLELASAALLFVLGSQQILIWPTISDSIPVRDTYAMLERITSSADQTIHYAPACYEIINLLRQGQTPYEKICSLLPSDAFIYETLERALSIAVLWVTVTGLFFIFGKPLQQVGRRSILWLSDFDTYRSFINNFMDYLAGRKSPIWPKNPAPDVRDAIEQSKSAADLDNFIFYSSLGATSLAFAMWVPQATLAIQHIPTGPFYALIVPWPFFILVFFIAGGIDIWVRAIEVHQWKGSAYTLGLWFGTFALYWMTTLVFVFAISHFLSYLTDLPQFIDPSLVSTLFILSYRVAFGSITILVAISRVRLLASENNQINSMRTGIAYLGLVTIISLPLHLIGLRSSLMPFLALGISIAAAFILLRFASQPSLHPARKIINAHLLASPSIAIAPLILSERIQNIVTSENGFAKLSVRNVGLSPDLLELRVSLAGSEDEVASRATGQSHADKEEQYDFVLTDIQTAIRIISACKRHPLPNDATFKIMSVVATIPSSHLSLREVGDTSLGNMILDSGFLGYTPPYGPVPDSDDPGQMGLNRPASYATVAFYAAFHLGDVGEVKLTEPFVSWLIRNTHKGKTVQPITSRKQTYVLLARYDEKQYPTVPYNWRRALVEMIVDGREVARDNQTSPNLHELERLRSFIRDLSRPNLDLELEDIHAALQKASFEPSFPSDALTEHALAVRELIQNRFLPLARRYEFLNRIAQREDSGKVLLEALISANVPLLYEEDDQDGRFFSFSYSAPQHPIPQSVSGYLHEVALVTLRDIPGELERLLAALRMQHPAPKVAILGQSTLGETQLIHLVNRESLPKATSAATLGVPIKARSKHSNWIDGLRVDGYNVFQIQALAVLVRNRPDGLVDVLHAISRASKQHSVTPEQIFQLPINNELSAAILIFHPKDIVIGFDALTSDASTVQPDSQEQSVYETASQIQISNLLNAKPYSRFIDFQVRLIQGRQVKFHSVLPTWNPVWGSVGNWVAEVRFTKLRLIIPYALSIQILSFGVLRKIPVIGHRLARSLPGAAGLNAYTIRTNWAVTFQKEDVLNTKT